MLKQGSKVKFNQEGIKRYLGEGHPYSKVVFEVLSRLEGEDGTWYIKTFAKEFRDKKPLQLDYLKLQSDYLKEEWFELALPKKPRNLPAWW